MVNLISVEKVSKAFGERPLLDSVSLGVSTGDRIGVVGRNGAGKSTLLSLLAGTGRAAQPDKGRIARSAGLRIGYLRQQDDLSGTVRQAVFGPGATAATDHGWAAGPPAPAGTAGLRGGIDLDAGAARLSGGERRRTALASLL